MDRRYRPVRALWCSRVRVPKPYGSWHRGRSKCGLPYLATFCLESTKSGHAVQAAGPIPYTGWAPNDISNGGFLQASCQARWPSRLLQACFVRPGGPDDSCPPPGAHSWQLSTSTTCHPLAGPGRPAALPVGVPFGASTLFEPGNQKTGSRGTGGISPIEVPECFT